MKYQRYAEYKDSGTEWFGDIPSHWNASKIGFLSLKIGSGKTPKGGNEVYSDSGVLFLRSQNVYDTGLHINDDEVVFISEQIDSEMIGSRVKGGDILLNITGASIGRTCIVPKKFQRANVNQHVCIIRVPDEFQSYVSMYLKSASSKAQIDAFQNGAAREGLNFEQLSNIKIAYPREHDERDQIATFLDRETGKIDTLIARQQQLIGLLQEKRQAVISHAVTKGLNPNAKMKDTGIHWLGEVPEHWKLCRVKNVAQINPSKSEVRNLPAETLVSFIPMEAIGEQGQLDLSRQKKLSEVINGYTYLSDNDLIIAKITPCFENGKGAIAQNLTSKIGFATTEVIPIRPFEKSDTEFIYFLLYANPFRSIAEGSMYGAGGQKRVADTFVAEYHMAYPPQNERLQIAEFLKTEIEKLDLLIQKSKETIQLLQERRTALISAAVTGKIDVRQAGN